MMNRTLVLKLAICAIFAGTLLVAGAAATPTYATGVCPTGQDACMIVNSNQDNNVRDGLLTLREAMLLDTGGLAYTSLDLLEQAQVRGEGMAFAAEGIRGMYFDTVMFCEGCATSTIFLQPPGFGGPAAASESDLDQVSLDYTPPGFGGPASLPPGFGGPAGGSGGGAMVVGEGLMASVGELMNPPGFGGPATSVGLGLLGNGDTTSANVVLDGSLLDASTAGMRVQNNGGWISAIHFQNFRGSALQIGQSVADSVIVGSNYDGHLDAAEAVTFFNNGTNVEVVQGD